MSDVAAPQRSAEAQNTVIPAGWKPTKTAPVPVVRCTATKTDGDRCGRWSIRGATVCRKHGGQLENVKDHAAAVVEAARLRLLDMTEDAVDVLDNLFQVGTPDAIRLKAATEVLDRAGIRGGFELDVEVDVKTNPSEVLAARIQQVRERMAEAQAEQNIILGEIVEDDEDEMLGQDTLFDI